MKLINKIMVVCASLLLFAMSSSSIFATENKSCNEQQLARIPTRQFSKEYSYDNARGRLDITYSINTHTGEIVDIISANVVNLTPGKKVILEQISFSGNTVTVSIGFDKVSQYDCFKLY